MAESQEGGLGSVFEPELELDFRISELRRDVDVNRKESDEAWRKAQ